MTTAKEKGGAAAFDNRQNVLKLFQLAFNGSLDEFREVLQSVVAAHQKDAFVGDHTVVTQGDILTECKEGNGRSVMHYAAMGDNDPIMEFVLAAAPEAAHPRDNEAETPLFGAARSNAGRAARRLLAGGADANARNAKDCAPIHYAADANALVVLAALLHAGCDVNSLSTEMGTPLQWATMVQNIDGVKMLLSQKADPNIHAVNSVPPPLALAASMGTDKSDNILELLLSHGADPLGTDGSSAGWTALHCAAEVGAAASVARLLAAGANTGVVVENQTAAQLACSKGHNDVAATIERLTNREV